MSAHYSIEEKVYGLLEVYSDKLTITPAKGVLGWLTKGLKGTKTIPFESITAIQLKECGPIFNGYIQFTIHGGNESKGGVSDALSDENTFMFSRENNALAIKIKEYVESETSKLRRPQTAAVSINLSDEIQKLASLKEQGILSDEEFQAAKKKLIR